MEFIDVSSLSQHSLICKLISSVTAMLPLQTSWRRHYQIAVDLQIYAIRAKFVCEVCV